MEQALVAYTFTRAPTGGMLIRFRLGQTKIFFRTGVLSRLEEERDGVLSKMLVGLQAYCRGKLARLAFRFHVGDHQAVAIIQRNVRT